MSREFSPLLGSLIAKRSLGPDEVRAAFEAILSGEWTPVQVGAFAVALRMAGETVETIAAAVEAMRAAMTRVHHGLPVVVDTCGTGGDGAQTLNLSSAAAVIVAACGIPVAKHGNRSASSRCGSADVFEAMGIPLDVRPDRQAGILRESGITFLFAQAHHPALRHAAVARHDLGTRTIFNILGPLANPAGATHQLVGVYDDSLRPLIAGALGRVGVAKAWVVRSEDGLDELSPAARTRVSELGKDGEVRERVVSPEDFGLSRTSVSDLAGGNAQENARAVRAIFEGSPHPAREAVILNAAAAIHLATADSLRDCAERARRSLEDGATSRTFERWKAAALRARES
jgi:anthranilate phosphoribosyltransferase